MLASPLIELWPRLPAVLRRPVVSALTRARLRSKILRLVNEPKIPTGFLTPTPETPPALDVCLEHVARLGVAGNYYEFGLFRGYTFWYAQRSALRIGLRDMQFYGFDSFCGLPAIEGVDAESGEFRKGDYSATLAQVKRNLDNHGVNWAKTHLVQGFFDTSLARFDEGLDAADQVAVALIDCDLYSSTIPVLEFLSKRLQDGSILMFDDWNCFNASDDMGERRAFREFLAAHPEWTAESFVSFGWHGQAFLLRGATW